MWDGCTSSRQYGDSHTQTITTVTEWVDHGPEWRRVLNGPISGGETKGVEDGVETGGDCVEVKMRVSRRYRGIRVGQNGW